MTALLIIIIIILYFSSIEAGCDARSAELDRHILHLEKELRDMERHEELVELHEELITLQKENHRIRIAELYYFERFLNQVQTLPEAHISRCTEAVRYLNKAKDGSFEAYEKVKEFVYSDRWKKEV